LYKKPQVAKLVVFLFFKFLKLGRGNSGFSMGHGAGLFATIFFAAQRPQAKKYFRYYPAQIWGGSTTSNSTTHTKKTYFNGVLKVAAVY
jgi:ABC-type Co2+ transport system permease subunit